jgi:hypothetical protein
MNKKILTTLSLASIFALSGCVVDSYPPYQASYNNNYTYHQNPPPMMQDDPNSSQFLQMRRLSSDATAASSFVQVALLDHFTYSYRNYHNKLDNGYVYFTSDAWDKEVTSFQGNEESKLVRNKASVSLIFNASPQVEQFGREQNTANPTYIWWNISVPADIVVKKINGETFVNHVVIHTTVISHRMKDYKIAKLDVEHLNY